MRNINSKEYLAEQLNNLGFESQDAYDSKLFLLKKNDLMFKVSVDEKKTSIRVIENYGDDTSNLIYRDEYIHNRVSRSIALNNLKFLLRD